MNDISSNSKILTIGTIELVVLLLLPLPFLNLNILYILLAIAISLASKYFRKEKWRDFGFTSIRLKKVSIAIIIGILFGLLDNFVLEPMLSTVFGEPDLSSFQGLKGNIGDLILLLALAWVVGGLFEEFFFRGYLFMRFRTVIRNPLMHKWGFIIITSAVFAFSHSYQGVDGIIGAFYFSVIMGLLYIYFKNVWYLILIHGVFDTVGVFRIYMS